MLRVRRSVTSLESAWANSDRPPWHVGNEPIELAKAAVLAGHLGDVTTVADCGCGGGDFFELLYRTIPRRFALVDGIDLAEGALQRAERTGIYRRLVRGRICEAPQRLEGPYDLVVVSDVLYYIDDYLASLHSLVDLMAPGGKIFVTLAMGARYFDARDACGVRSLLEGRGLRALASRVLDYTLAGIPRRRVPGQQFLWAQTHKTVDIYQRQ